MEEKWIKEARKSIKADAEIAFENAIETAQKLDLDERWAIEIFVNEIHRLQKKKGLI